MARTLERLRAQYAAKPGEMMKGPRQGPPGRGMTGKPKNARQTVRRLMTVQIRKEQPIERKAVAKNASANVGGDNTAKKKPVKKVAKPGRNDPCPCGKWKEDGSRRLKYKECCGKNE